MSYVLKLRDVIVGRSDLETRDTARSAARGSFRPGLGWELVEPIFDLARQAGAHASDADRARYRRARDTLALALYANDGALVDTVRIEILRDDASPTGLVLDTAIVDPAFWR
jgi:hypothetical protein